MRLQRIILTSFIFLLAISSQAQQAAITGYVRNPDGYGLGFVNLALAESSKGTSTDEEGFFFLPIPANKQITLRVSYLGYAPHEARLILGDEEILEVTIVLTPLLTELPDIEVRGRQILSDDIVRLEPRHATVIPGPTGGVEGLIHTLPGVSTSTELSVQYSVRGGNYDENLVYVNGIEIYRPFLVRSGQHEGLSFLNPAMVSSIEFSAGGFNPEYGDKMSSVLDITYKTPDAFAGSFSLSLLEGSLHLEGLSQNQRISFLVGARYKSNQYLLGTLDTQGDYQPFFTDIQTLLRYHISDQWTFSFLGNYNNNRFQFAPDVQRTRFGTMREVREFSVFFQGQEVNQFATTTGALSLDYAPHNDLKLRISTSLFQTDESEHFDILGQYWLHRVETDMGRDDFGQPTGQPLGVGSFLNHARNYLHAIVWNAETRGQWNIEPVTVKWGLKFQYEDIYDRLNEWSLVDSAGFSLPRHPEEMLVLQDTLRTQIGLVSNRVSAFAQGSWEFYRHHGRFQLTAGLRTHFWDFNRQWVVSPRSTLLYKPEWASKWSFRASAGYYHQPPFYRELRDLQGILRQDVRAQESIHFVLGSTYYFSLWNRPFRYTTEAYYKVLNNLIPYELDNLRIRYYAENSSSGYAAGIDFKVNGEFVPGVESWAGLSFMQTKEIIAGAFVMDQEGNKQPAGYIPRPGDQRFAFSLFFQDFLPRNPSYQMQLGYYFGTGLPFWPPGPDKLRNTGRMRSYQRLDIGFSKQLVGGDNQRNKTGWWQHVESVWITAEVFNLLEINNTISYTWITDVENQQFAIPNYLTSRLINLKLLARF